MYKSNKYKHMIKKALLGTDKSCLYECYYCYAFIPTDNQTEYEKQVILCHDEKIAYPSIEDLKKII